MDVAFDVWFSERSRYERGVVEEVIRELENRGYVYEKVLYVSCALYEDKMLKMYPQNVDIMIINTTLYKKNKAY